MVFISITSESMELKHNIYFMVLLLVVPRALCASLYELEDVASIGHEYETWNETQKIYNDGVNRGIIDPKIYSLESFEADERNIFKDLYKDFISMNYTMEISYQDWLIMNNFGLLPDTKESLFEKKTFRSVRSSESSERWVRYEDKRFSRTVREGDILITSGAGKFGHAALMMTDDYVLDMAGGDDWLYGIEDNNRLIHKDKWFNEYDSYWIHVYRYPDKLAAKLAAKTAHFFFYNPHFEFKKLRHIKYSLEPNSWTLDPNYCSKLVIQAYYFGPTHVMNSDALDSWWILPNRIPLYFRYPYYLINLGKY